MTPIDRILPLLTKPRRRQPGQWSACCPAHDDKGPSLSIRETPEGAVLLHCFAGCEVSEVVGAIGLELHELFPPKERPAGSPARTPKVLTAAQALDILHDEAQFVGVCAGNIGGGIYITESERERVLQAAGRIAYIRTEVMT